MTDIAPLVVQGRDSFHMLSLAEVIDDTKETAGSWAAEHIQLRPDFGWIVGRFVEADKPNRNGHIFPVEQLRTRHQLVVNTYLNMLHRAHHVVGAYTAAKLLPGAGGQATTEAAAAVLNPHVETVSTFWRYAFPDEYKATRRAFQEGAAWQSMEAVPRTIACVECIGGLDQALAWASTSKEAASELPPFEFDYQGPCHDSYCAHLRASPRAPRVLNDAHFVGGAIIIPPTRPGWGNADIRDVAGVIESYPDEAEQVYETVREAAAHLDSGQWEKVMALVLANAFGGEPVPFTIAPGAPEPEPTLAEESVALEAQAANNGKKGAMVCITPPRDIAEQLAALGDEDVDVLHVTLAFLGDLSEDGEMVGLDSGDEVGPMTHRDVVIAAVAAFAAGAPPLPKAKVSGIGEFDIGDGNAVIYASVDVPGLPEFRERLVAALDAAHVPISRLHGLSPHISLRYTSADQAPPPASELPPGLEWPVTAIEVWWSDEQKFRFELADGRIPLPA